MPIRYDVDEERQFVRSYYTGRVSAAELLAHVRNLNADERIKAQHRGLIDLSGTSDMEFNATIAKAIVDMEALAERVSGTRTAIWAPSDLLYGMARIFATLATAPGAGRAALNIFREEDKALAWLEEEKPER